jgi:hypothetical protein
MIQKRSNSKAYKGIMTFMSELKNYMVSKHPEYVQDSITKFIIET